MRISRAGAECAEGENNAAIAPLVRPSWGQLNFLGGFYFQGLGQSEDVSSGSNDLSRRFLSKPESEQSGTSVCSKCHRWRLWNAHQQF